MLSLTTATCDKFPSCGPTNYPSCCVQLRIWSTSTSETVNTNRSVQRQTCRSANLCTTNYTWNTPGLDHGLCGEKPATNGQEQCNSLRSSHTQTSVRMSEDHLGCTFDSVGSARSEPTKSNLGPHLNSVSPFVFYCTDVIKTEYWRLLKQSVFKVTETI
jgi:hypothetical protein